MGDARYDLLVKIASGGMGTVYLGRRHGEHGFSRLVAIKRAHTHLLEDPSARAMFLAEARISAAIRNAHVVSVQDVDADGEDIQLVMDYVEGGPLSALLNRGPLPRPIALRILLDACIGLHAAHTQRDASGELLGIVHRDVSPHNILVGAEDGMARITDFGIAKLAQPGTPLTRSGVVRGKVGYFAPEYARGAKADMRSDMFSLGVVVWETLVGRRLFTGTNEAEMLLRVIQEEAPPPSLFDEALAPYDDVLAKCLARDPDARFESVERFAAALEDVARRDGIATHAEVADRVRQTLGPELDARRARVAEQSQEVAPSLGPDTGTLATVVDEPRPRRVRRLGLAIVGAAACAVIAVVGWRALKTHHAAPAVVTPSPSITIATTATSAAETLASSPATTTPTPPPATAAAATSKTTTHRPSVRPRPTASHYPRNPY
jgi:serine/threonine-protein kinase